MAPNSRSRGMTPPTQLAQAQGDPRSAAKAKQRSAKQSPSEQMYNPMNYKNNVQLVYFMRIYMTIVAGAAVGIWGITGLPGFYAYLASQALATVPVLLKAGGNVKKYFPSWDKVLLDHVFSSTAILSYILSWMVFYNLAHVFT